MSPLHQRLARQPHRVFVADERPAPGSGSGNGIVETRIFSIVPIGLVFSMPLAIFTRHVPHWPRPWQLTILADRRANAVEPLCGLTPALSASLRRLAPTGNFDFLLFLDELDDRHAAVDRNADGVTVPSERE